MRMLAAILFAALALPANATFHLWYINEVYSNASGTVQYIEMKAAASGQQFIRGHTIRSSSGSTTNSYTFPNDLPGDSADSGYDEGYGYGGGYGGAMSYKSFLIATQGFAALGIVAPDFVVPNGFLFPGGGTINFGEGASTMTHGALPTDNRSISADRAPQTTSPMNFLGLSAQVPAGNATNTASTSYQGLWLGPNATESGWGINFTHQGSVLFATWFTYGSDGAMWLVMSNGAQTTAGRFTGDLYRTTGPGFNADPFTAIGASNYTPVGSLSVTFSDANNGSMTYTVNGVTQTKSISRYVYASPAPACELGGSAGASPNFGDLWYRSESESGWGVNIVHQGDILFATWFTYETGGSASSPAKGMWLVMSNGGKTANNTYSGALQRTTGPNAFSASSAFDPNQVQRNTVGDATFTFSDASTGTFRYTVNGVTQTKPIQRLTIAAPRTVCR